jgi:beta-glucosidase
MRLGIVLVMAMVGAGLAAPAASAQEPPFRNPALPLETRVDDLLRRLTLSEKVSLLHQFQPAVPRLGIGEFRAGTEALHGLAWTTERTRGDVVTAKATVFPQAIGLASTWNPDLIKRVGSAVGDEARGYHSEEPGFWGLQLWAPVVNLLRDPRWGRNEEGYSEDPYLTGAISTAYGHGLQGDDPFYLKTAPVLKHYLANNNEIRRDTTSSNLRPRVKHEYDEPAFKAAISADAATGVMGGYNLVNGRPNTVSPDFDDVVRGWTRRTLFNVSDAFAPYNLTGSQRYYATNLEGFAATLKAGLDSFTVDGHNPAPTIQILNSALAQGLLTEADVDTAVRHVVSIRFRLGEFDPNGGPYAGITKDVVNSPAHRRLARRSAAEAMVLLKNSGGALPLDPRRTRGVAVIGPLADTLYTDWYSGALPYRVTALSGISERLGDRATVTGTEAVDRIALREVESGRYVTGGDDADGDLLRLADGGAGGTQQFDVFDWGQGIVTLRSVANGKVVGRSDFSAESTFANNQDQPNGWFVQQQFELEAAGDGAYVIRYAGYEVPETWEGPNNYVTVDEDGVLRLGAPTPATAARFTKDTLSSGVESAVRAATEADAAIVVVGSMPFINGREAHDRTTMALAEGQSALIRAVRRANPNTILVVENSYPTTLNWEQENVPAILWTTHAGQETGRALADVLFGDVNPAGRLTQTWYRSESDLPDILEYDVINARRTYLYFDGRPLYPFGHGLSYTTFRYGGLDIRRSGESVQVRIEVTNAGKRAGDEVVQLYTHQRDSRDVQPNQQLRAFARVSMAPGETKSVRLTVPVADLAHWDVTRGRWVVESSEYDVMVGASSGDIRRRAAVRIDGERIPPRDLDRETRAIDFDDYRGVELVDESKVRGDAIDAGAGDWIKFADADLDAQRGVARVARAGDGPAAVEVRLDDPVRGHLAGTIPVPSTGDVYTYVSSSAPLSGARGRRDVYLVFTGELRISSFSLER